MSMSMSRDKKSRGFTMLELMIGMFIFLVLAGAVLAGMAGLQKNYRSNEMRDNTQQRIRATMELMEQEIGEAGLQASTVEGPSAATTGGAPYLYTSNISTGSQTLTLNTSNGLFVGKWMQVDGGANQEQVQLQTVTGAKITATFNTAHTGTATAPVPMYPMGVFPHGVMAGSPGDPSTSSKLVLYGDLHGSGNGLYAVEYTCSAPYLYRQEWNLDAGGTTTGQVPLLDTVSTTANSCYFCWPGSAAAVCSSNYPNTVTPNGTSTPDTVTLQVPSDFPFASFPAGLCSSAANTCNYTMITQVGFTVSTTETDPASGQTLTMSKSFSNIQPRNIIAADNIYLNNKSSTTFFGELQPDPTSLASITNQF